MHPDHHVLRQSIRRQRRQLTAVQARDCALRLARHAGKHPLLRNSRHIGAYLANDGELDPGPLLERLWARGKTLYLPVLVPFNHGKLWFARYAPGDTLILNRFGIPEPQRRVLVRPSALDLVLTPLVAWDRHGHRVGMGGGFYDRSFAFLLTRRYWRRPVMLGVAYRFQQQDSLMANSWDVPLDAVATEAGVQITGTE